ncbi:MAG: hypothetical protein AAGF88_01050 [Pseudomonadota bacterium]
MIALQNKTYEAFLNAFNAVSERQLKTSESWALWEIITGIYLGADDEGGLVSHRPVVEKLLRAAEYSVVMKYLGIANELGLVIAVTQKGKRRYFLTAEARDFVERIHGDLLDQYGRELREIGE